MSKLGCIGALLAMLFSVAHTTETLHAQGPTTADAALAGMRASIVRAIGAQDQTVEITMANNILTVLRINSNMNQATHGARDNEATAIVSVVSKAISGKSEFSNLHTIRIRYASRSSPGANSSVVDTVDFRKDSQGAFEFHRT